MSDTSAVVAKFSPEGKLLLEFGSFGTAPGQFSTPSAVALDAAGNIYVADRGNRRIQKFNSKGALQQIININTGAKYQDTDLVDIALDPDGNIYVVDSFVHHNILKYSPEGRLLVNFNEANANQKLLYHPTSIALSSSGEVYIADQLTHKIQVYNANGIYQREIYHPYGDGEGYLDGDKVSLALDSEDNIFAADRRWGGCKVIWYDKNTAVRKVWGNLYTANQLAMDEAGNVYLIDDSKNYVYSIGVQVIKFDATGKPTPLTTISEFLNNNNFKDILDIALDIHGNIYLLSNTFLNKGILKFNSQGEFLAKYTDFGPNVGWETYSNIHVDINGNIYLGDYGQGRLRKLGPDGTFLQLIGAGTGDEFKLGEAIASDIRGNVYVLDYLGARVQKFDPTGKLVLTVGKYGWEDTRQKYNHSDMAVDAAGNIYVASNKEKKFFRVYDTNGNLKYEKEQLITSLAVNRRGTQLVAVDANSDAYTLYHSNTYNSLESTISGIVYHDLNQDCEPGKEEARLAGIVVEATPGPSYGITDKDGHYTLTVAPGTYALRQILPNDTGRSISQNCSLEPVEVPAADLSITDINFGNRVTLSPYLSVSVSSTRRRRCFESTTTVHYTNSGFAPAPDAKVYLQLPKEVGLLSSDRPHTLLADGTYEFSVGDLAAGQSGTITVEDIVTCGDESVRGLTVCTRAWITPSNNQPAEPTPTVSITGRCSAETGMIRFVVRNTGTADMADPGLFRKYADGQLASVEQFRLAAGDSLVLWVPAMGYTWRLEADQPTGNGDNTAVSVTVEGCPGAEVSSVSTGKVNLLPADDEEAEQSAECMPITDSYDPNDKLVTPVGRTEEFYTPTNTALKYKVRFQNTGTDVAYRVVVVDTLSEHLDLSTLQLGATSHPARVEVSGKGRPVLTWTFDNILLPDSTADEPGSHGYVLFSIKPKADLAEKTLVENFSDIFFDFNSPIRTNVTQNRIYDMPPVISESVRVRLEDVLATPGIASFEPAAGKLGSEVTITGQRFAAKSGDNKVYLNGRAATVLSATATELKVLVPAGATTGEIKVVTPDGGVTSAAKFQVYQPPVLASFSPAEGMVGQRVTLSGEHLQAVLVEGVKLGGLECEIIGHDGNAVTVRVPENAATGAFTISTRGGEAVSGAAYTVWYVPVIAALNKETDIVGASLTITGDNFAADKARNIVRFGQAQAQVLEASPQQLTVRVPEQAASGFITVETPGGKATAGTAFEVIPAPKFTAMQPSSGTVGTVVEITGAHFGIMGQQDVITFNGREALVLEASGDRYRVRVPRGAATGRVTITGYGGQAQSIADFVVEELAPTEAIQVYPNPNSGQFTVSLRHADFDVQLIEVHDALGKRLHQTRITGPRPEAVEISLPTAKSGLYFLQIQTERGLIIRKLTIL
ncbi:IPT/TIG domain-containing protein [uncultured Pontibacter sp.]|uniref:DUF7619 domain-containing protein n=1 Tax=uncultured Pontibacter sp. TaxID=453356 RepID=UPI002607A4D1|nr:IPT/TIG domain-containing protein [uncultured Pontibacter sp.]